MGTAAGILQNLASAAIWEVGRRSWLRLSRHKYTRVFGSDASGGRLYIAVGALAPPPVVDANNNRMIHIFPKTGLPGHLFSASQVISNCEVRAAKYLVESVAVNAGNWSVIATDEEIKDQRDLSFVSIGLMSNLKTIQLLENTSNSLVRCDASRFVSKASGRLLVRNLEERPNEDHGLILKINPSNLPERTWICCAGLDEWGTSGAAWYLARRWRELRSRFGKKPFATIVRVHRRQDESAEAVVMGTTPEEIDRFARE
ncbi:MAG: hypothetical protein LAP38_26785 [Acidobacteriia bacterium]|nr:hypothetical protein [Terriglobia bacterium]